MWARKKKESKFCVVDNEITTNSIYYTTIPSNGNAHGIQTTAFLFSIENIQSNCVTRSTLLTHPFVRLPEKFLWLKHTTFTFKTHQTFIFVGRCFECSVAPFCFSVYLRCHFMYSPTLFASLSHPFAVSFLVLSIGYNVVVLFFFRFSFFSFRLKIRRRTNTQSLSNFVLFYFFTVNRWSGTATNRIVKSVNWLKAVVAGWFAYSTLTMTLSPS